MPIWAVVPSTDTIHWAQGPGSAAVCGARLNKVSAIHPDTGSPAPGAFPGRVCPICTTGRDCWRTENPVEARASAQAAARLVARRAPTRRPGPAGPGRATGRTSRPRPVAPPARRPSRGTTGQPREVVLEMERLRRNGIRSEYLLPLALDRIAWRNGLGPSVRAVSGGLPGQGKRR